MVTETVATGSESTLLYRFLVSPGFRWMRYSTLALALGAISFNQVFIIFLDYRELLGGWIHALVLLHLSTYAAVIYLNLFRLFPKYLLKGHYLAYLSLLSAAMLAALSVQMAAECAVYSYGAEWHAHGPCWSVQTVMDYISSFMLSLLCMIGVTMTVLLKEWMVNNRRVAQMEKMHVASEVERLKEQISPELLFNTLHYSGELALDEPEKASKILMELSQLLRYQLYDCNRAKVLLGSEMTFLDNYLALEKISRPQFSYEFVSEGEVNRILVPPLLFIPFVQHVIKAVNRRRIQSPVSLDVRLKAEQEAIVFSCTCPEAGFPTNEGLERILQRLDILYGNRYVLSLTVHSIWLRLEGGGS